MLNATEVANTIITLYKVHGGAEYAGEKVSQLEHAVQSAQLAAERGFDEEVVLAAFLHDIGHICVSAYPVSNMNGYGVMNHEKIGAAYLRNRRFSNRVVELVQGHVLAKRYLTCVQPGYYEQLSEASKKTLEYQGGRMMPDEARLFEQHPTFHTQIALREIDEAAKMEQLPTPSLNTFHKLIEQHLTQQYAHETYSTGSI